MRTSNILVALCQLQTRICATVYRLLVSLSGNRKRSRERLTSTSISRPSSIAQPFFPIFFTVVKLRSSLTNWNTFGTRCLRCLLGISYKDRIRNEFVYEKSKLRPLIELVHECQLQWIGHAIRRKADEPLKTFALYEPDPSSCSTKRDTQPSIYSHIIASLLSYESNCVTDVERLNNQRIKRKARGIAYES